MDVKAINRYVRLSPDKARDLARKLRGLSAAEALHLTAFNSRKAAAEIGKTLKSAMANAAQREGMNMEALRIKEAVVEEGPRLKRFWPRARGGVRPIRRRMCHLRIVLTDGQKEEPAAT